MSKPARILVLSTIAAGILLSAWLSVRSAYEPYQVLFSKLEPDDASTIVAKLKEQKVEFRITGDGTTIEVPESKVHELRLVLASAVRGGGVGFESFEKLRIGATEFEQRVAFRRASEGELGRTIQTIAAVENARVHLVLPEKSVFAARKEPASASVVVKLRDGLPMGPQEVASIVHLVAAAVPGLKPENVSLVTTEGTMLHRPTPLAEGETGKGVLTAGGLFEEDPEKKALLQRRAMEAQLEERARNMFEKILGPGHVDVRVSAELDQSRIERTEDVYDPARSAVRSKETLMERTVPPEGDIPVAGVPGAESNLPTGAAPGAELKQTAGTVTKQSETVNNEVTHTLTKSVTMQGAIKRLTIAVAVDGKADASGAIVPRSREDLDRLALLAGSAVGADAKRGDVVTVESVPFLSSTNPLIVPDENIIPQKYRKFVPLAVGGVAGLALVTALLVARRRAKARKLVRDAEAAAALAAADANAPQLSAAEAAAALQLEAGPELPALSLSDREEAIRRATEDPATAALVLRHWLGTTAEEQKPEQANAA